MLDSLLVCNFRIFKELRIERLGQVNLFVGMNNSGKSCLLEAVYVYASNASPRVLYQLISQRDESWEEEIQPDDGSGVADQETFVRYLFHGYHLPELGDDGIEIGPLEPKTDYLRLRVRQYQITEDQQGARRRVPISPNEVDDFSALEIESMLEIEEQGKRRPLMPIKNFQDFRRRRFMPFTEERSRIESVPTNNLDESSVSSLWDNINLTNLQDEVIRCLKLINPDVWGIALVGDTRDRIGRRRIPVIRFEHSSDRFPLKSMGDGLTRLFHIVLALINAKDGILLVDEFENGLHWSVLPKVWEAVFRLAQRLNVQVFATTHSRDCIRGFETAWERNECLGSFHRLNQDSDKGAIATSYNLETLSDALEMDVEVR